MSTLRSRLLSLPSTAVAMVDDLTPGQRWTSALMLIMATLVVAFGLPSHTIVQQSAAEPPTPRAAPPTTAPAPSVDRPASASPAVPPPAVPTIDDDTVAAPPESIPEVKPLPERPGIVALVRSDPTQLGSDDASIAAAFLDSARFDATVIELSDNAGLCERVAAAGRLVIASHGVPEPLRGCLVKQSVTIVAHDALGGVVPFLGGGQVISTRRSHRSSLVDLGRWALDTDALGSAPGLVVSAEYRPEIEPAVADLARMGIEFAATSYLPAGAGRDPEILAGVQAFADAGVDTVVFAADVDDQARWVEVQRLLGSPTTYLVSDVGDAVVEEGYPPFFGEARAHTSLRTPWWERRAEGPSATQQECRTHWEGAAPPGASVAGSELLLAYLWCQHAWLMVEPVLDLVDAGTPFADALRQLVVDSPATSRLGPLGPVGWGPRQDVVLAWDGDCGCWAPEGAFRPR